MAARAPISALFVLDPLVGLNPAKDTSLVLIGEALRRGHRAMACELPALGLRGGEPIARAFPVALDDAGRAFESGPAELAGLEAHAVVLMRKDPPVDDAYLTATWILDRARDRTLVINDPRSLRDVNEKLGILDFPGVAPETLVSADLDQIRGFVKAHGGRAVVKPVFGYGGRGVLLAREGDPNLGSVLEIATSEGTRWTVAQAYVEAAREGDKRILLIDGEPIGAVLRVPAADELRDNFHAGGTAVAAEIDGRDRAICEQVGPWLRQRGLFFAGLDVIGGLLTEINVTSPTGMQEINRLGGLSGDHTMQSRFWTALERKLWA